jgi:hypothetical protein
MSLTEITIDDHNQLNRFRIQRLRQLFAHSLQPCLMRVNPDNMLAVHCPDPGIVDELLNEIEDLCNYAWLVLGVRSIGLYFCQEEILHTHTVEVDDMQAIFPSLYRSRES